MLKVNDSMKSKEGFAMTKPSYEERPECPTCKADAIYGSREDLAKALARVRGLLQRMAQNMKSYGRHLPNCRTQRPSERSVLENCDCGFLDAWKWANQSSVPSGAESADIGKVDTADKRKI